MIEINYSDQNCPRCSGLLTFTYAYMSRTGGLIGVFYCNYCTSTFYIRPPNL